MPDTTQIDEHGSTYLGAIATPVNGLSVKAHFGRIDGRVECIGVDIRSYREERDTPDGPPTGRVPVLGQPSAVSVTATKIRRMPLGAVIEDLLDDLRLMADWAQKRHLPDLDLDSLGERVGDDQRTWTSNDILQVAAVYADALDQRKPPRATVAKRLGITPSNASKQIARAVDAGLLTRPPTGKPSAPTAALIDKLDALQSEQQGATP